MSPKHDKYHQITISIILPKKHNISKMGFFSLATGVISNVFGLLNKREDRKADQRLYEIQSKYKILKAKNQYQEEDITRLEQMIGSLEVRNDKLECKLDGERVKFEKAIEDMHQEALEKERALGREAVAKMEIKYMMKLLIQ
jgi:alcohol dehydrogenase YqhD (iron-dependent ADH family)